MIENVFVPTLFLFIGGVFPILHKLLNW